MRGKKRSGRAEKDVQAEGQGGPKLDDDDNISLFLVVGFCKNILPFQNLSVLTTVGFAHQPSWRTAAAMGHGVWRSNRRGPQRQVLRLKTTLKIIEKIIFKLP
jgi:hypothetical protein